MTSRRGSWPCVSTGPTAQRSTAPAPPAASKPSSRSAGRSPRSPPSWAFSPPTSPKPPTAARDVTEGTRKAVAALYDRWWNLTPPLATTHDLIAYRRSLAYAKARGWLPPLALDDDRIDDPRWTPDSLSTDGPGNGRLHPEDVEFLLDAGCTRAEILSRLSIAPKALQNILTRHGRADLWQRLRDDEERRRTAPRRVA